MSTGHMKRHAEDAGYSWRKWGDPLMYGALETDLSRSDRLRLAFVHVLWWVLCAEAGVYAALLVTAP